jgi:SAM-dependent methyltransferase
MITSTIMAAPRAGLAFDSIAEQYDEVFTRSLVGRAQRDAVWDVLRQEFRSGDSVLELNCGTGEDALFLARMGASVLACDASERMISVAARRMATELGGGLVQLELLATERIGQLQSAGPFDGVFSNFSGLNCVADLADVARQLASLVNPPGKLLLCLSTRVCLWETVWYLAHRQPIRASRRWKGGAVASLGEIPVSVRYFTMNDIRKFFRPFFSLRACRGIGVTVPPSYVESFARRHPGLLKKLQATDRVIAGWPGFRSVGDHMLLSLTRTNA